jgi:uncharacterized repeat protein (TIGR03803 family)
MIAGCDDMLVSFAAFEEAVRRFPHSRIPLRQGTHVLKEHGPVPEPAPLSRRTSCVFTGICVKSLALLGGIRMAKVLYQPLLVSVAALVFLGVSAAHPAAAWTYHVIYSFCSQQNCADGAIAGGPLVMDSSGNLYGMTGSGGAGRGTVFELSLRNGHWRERVLCDFQSSGVGSCLTGSSPTDLIIDKSGNLYGTTANGGPPGSDAGTVFELIKKRSGWSYKALYLFCTAVGSCTDGWQPQGLGYAGASEGLPYDGRSALYGATSYGGQHGHGVVFELKRKKGSWREHAIYSFCSQTNCTDGATPYSGITVAPSGILYGTTSQGGTGAGGGVLYQLSSTDSRNWNQTILYSFCSQASCADGGAPEAAPLLDSAGDLFGTTAYDGTQCDGDYPCGVAFVVKASGREATVHPFCSADVCKEGTSPTSGLVRDSSGNLYGTTFYGGAYGNEAAGGIVYQLSGRKFHVLYNFCTDRLQCTDGDEPGPLILDGSGNLYGTTVQGGAFGSGAVFELTP